MRHDYLIHAECVIVDSRSSVWGGYYLLRLVLHDASKVVLIE